MRRRTIESALPGTIPPPEVRSRARAESRRRAHRTGKSLLILQRVLDEYRAAIVWRDHQPQGTLCPQ